MMHCGIIENAWIGPVTLIEEDGKLTNLAFGAVESGYIPMRTPLLEKAALELREYFAGVRREFDLPIQLEGTPFQISCWQALMRIPFGETCSYAFEARLIGRPGAFRAVGNANGKNPLPIIVPCHRVIASDGTIGGYSGGLAVKEKLLCHEKKYLTGEPLSSNIYHCTSIDKVELCGSGTGQE